MQELESHVPFIIIYHRKIKPIIVLSTPITMYHNLYFAVHSLNEEDHSRRVCYKKIWDILPFDSAKLSAKQLQ